MTLSIPRTGKSLCHLRELVTLQREKKQAEGSVLLGNYGTLSVVSPGPDIIEVFAPSSILGSESLLRLRFIGGESKSVDVSYTLPEFNGDRDSYCHKLEDPVNVVNRSDASRYVGCKYHELFGVATRILDTLPIPSSSAS